MAKSKKIKLEVPKESAEENVKTGVESISNQKVDVDREAISPETKSPTAEGKLKTVIGITEAEKLQKSGWRLIDCHLTPEGNKYKFRKVN